MAQNSSDFFDAIIVGGGPAGAVTALCLSRLGKRAALVEATHFNGERYGETVPPEINPVLRKLGIEASFHRLGPLEAPGIISSWGSESQSTQDFVSNPHGCGWHVDRKRFDAMLCREAVASGATLFVDMNARPLRQQGGNWSVGDLETAFLIDASGRNGLRLGQEHSWETDDTLLAIVVRAEGGDCSDLRTVIETTPLGWWYCSPLPNGQLILMFFTSPEVYSGTGVVLGEQMDAAPTTASRVTKATIVSSRVVHAPSACRRVMAGDSWLAVGDSASSYDPLSGRGIFKALQHGMAAAEAVDRGENEPYVGRVRREFGEYVRQRRAFYASEQRWPDSPFWLPRSQPSGGAGPEKGGH